MSRAVQPNQVFAQATCEEWLQEVHGCLASIMKSHCSWDRGGSWAQDMCHTNTHDTTSFANPRSVAHGRREKWHAVFMRLSSMNKEHR